MEFETFSRKTAARTKQPVITVQRRGNLSLSHSAVEMLNPPEKSDHYQVDLLYNAEQEVIALRLAGEDNPNPHLLRRQKNGNVYLVSGKLFTKHYGIDTSRARRFKAKSYGDGVVGICLRDDYAEVGRKKKPDDPKKEQREQQERPWS